MQFNQDKLEIISANWIDFRFKKVDCGFIGEEKEGKMKDLMSIFDIVPSKTTSNIEL